ncbi:MULTISPECIES: fasciclin domain-containing protein [unclassified Psychrobacter]|uniref:fasciclin domain-containing protein n=1 Tax=unclassified Psychrobacter TaxID=196806 RepID=UPI0018F69352|nr:MULTISPECIES: fasciclin domain-containing protein [unclassified Psychrobacter]
MLNLKTTLLPLAVAMTLPLAACSNNETAETDTAEVEAPMTEDQDMAADTDMATTEPMAETDATMSADDMATAEADGMATQSIGEMAAANENLTVLTAALKAADLDSMLMENGEYTVFAPTDEAFNKLLTDMGKTKEELLADTETLKKVLPYHVVGKVVKAADIPYGQPIETENGGTFTIGEDNTITDASGNKAKIVGTDMMATNGVVHTIDTVLMPK